MNNRPRSITIISWIFIVLGAVTLIFGLLPPIDESAAQQSADPAARHPLDHAYVHVIRATAIVCGVAMLYGHNWGRWLLVVWIAGHVLIGFWHSLWGSVVHVVLFGVILYFLFRPQASAYFRGTSTEPAQIPLQEFPEGR
jgi:hypothetical protein